LIVTYDFEVHQQAEDLYVLEGLTQQAVSERIDIPLRTIELWSADEGWKAKRKEYRRASSEIRRNKMLYRLALLRQGLESLDDPQKAYAWATVERVARDDVLPEGRPAIEPPSPELKIETAQDAVDALLQAVKRKVTVMLTRPDELNMKGIKEMRDALGILDELKARYADKPEEARRAYDEREARYWREKVLGVR